MSNEQRQEKSDAIRDGIQRVIGLLDDVMVVGHSGMEIEAPAPLDLVQVCQQIIRGRERITGHADRVVFSSADLCESVVVDPTLVRQVVRQLLHNAAKFSPPNSTIWFDVECDAQQVVFQVRDQGMGIPKIDQALIFEAFYRAGNVGTIPGTGLGLAIVKQLVEMHGGTIAFESQEGIGTTFTVSIPQVLSRTYEVVPGD